MRFFVKIYMHQIFVFFTLFCHTCSILVNKNTDWGNKQPAGDDESLPIVLNQQVPIGSSSYQNFYISYNGGIFTVPNYKTMILTNAWTKFPTVSLLGYWADTNFKRACTDGCGMFISKNPSDQVLSTINSAIKNGFSANSERTLIVTWYKAPSYKPKPAPVTGFGFWQNTFQVILTSDGKNTYFIAGYDNITYPQQSEGGAKIGFYQDSNFRIEFPGSGNVSFAQKKLTCQSNINIPGVYIAALTSLNDYQVTLPGISKLSSTCSDCQEDTLNQCAFEPTTTQPTYQTTILSSLNATIKSLTIKSTIAPTTAISGISPTKEDTFVTITQQAPTNQNFTTLNNQTATIKLSTTTSFTLAEVSYMSEKTPVLTSIASSIPYTTIGSSIASVITPTVVSSSNEKTAVSNTVSSILYATISSSNIVAITTPTSVLSLSGGTTVATTQQTATGGIFSTSSNPSETMKSSAVATQAGVSSTSVGTTLVTTQQSAIDNVLTTLNNPSAALSSSTVAAVTTLAGVLSLSGDTTVAATQQTATSGISTTSSNPSATMESSAVATPAGVLSTSAGTTLVTTQQSAIDNVLTTLNNPSAALSSSTIAAVTTLTGVLPLIGDTTVAATQQTATGGIFSTSSNPSATMESSAVATLANVLSTSAGTTLVTTQQSAIDNVLTTLNNPSAAMSSSTVAAVTTLTGVLSLIEDTTVAATQQTANSEISTKSLVVTSFSVTNSYMGEKTPVLTSTPLNIPYTMTGSSTVAPVKTPVVVSSTNGEFLATQQTSIDGNMIVSSKSSATIVSSTFAGFTTPVDILSTNGNTLTTTQQTTTGSLGRECNSTNCLNGTCQPDNTCACFSGMTGFDCSEECKTIVNCLTNPCDGALCWPGFVCKANYCGGCNYTCVADLCYSNPCLNNSTCVAAETYLGYFCKCSDPWEGPNCNSLKPCEGEIKCDDICDYDSNFEKRCYCNMKPIKSNGSCEQDNFLFVGSTGYISIDLTEENQLQKTRPIKHQDIIIQGQATGLCFVSSLQFFYTDQNTKTIRMLFNGSDEVLINAMNPEVKLFKAIAYDALNNTLFWGEDKKIWGYNNGTSFLWLETDDYVYSIIILYEECRRRIYWAESGSISPGIYYTSLNPLVHERKVLYRSKSPVYGFAADHENQKFYFVQDLKFYSINFDGSCQQYLGESPTNIFTVVYFENALFMTIGGSNSLMKYDIVRNKTINIIKYENRPYGLAVHQAPPVRFCEEKSKCTKSCWDNGGCSDICNVTNNEIICSCSEGILAPDNRTCYDDTTFMYASLSNSVLRWNEIGDLETINDFHDPEGSINIVAMDHDFEKKLLYYSLNTPTLSIINVMNINGSNRKALYIVKGGVVDGMAFDWTRNILFYAEKWSGVYSLNLTAEILTPVLVSRNQSSLVYPRAMVLENCARSLFVTFWGNNSGYIARFFLNNTMTIIAGNLVFPNSLAIDREDKKLYWADSFHKRIESSNFDGSCRQIIAFVQGYYPFSMFYSNKMLFWINWVDLNNNNQNSILVTNIMDKKTVSYKNISSRGYALHLFQNESFGQCSSNFACDIIPFLPVYPPNNQNLFPYGDLAFDNKVPPGDDNGVEFILSRYIPLFSNFPSVNRVYINVNGIISLNGVSAIYEISSITSQPLLAVYAADFNISQVGNVYYRESVDPAVLMNVTAEIRDIYDASFNASHIIIATWEMVPAFSNPNLMSTFQSVIASDDTKSFAIFYYQRLDAVGGQVGYVSDVSCSPLILPFQKTDLLELGKVVLKLSECDNSSITTSTPPNNTDTGKILSMKFEYIQNLFQINAFNYLGSSFIDSNSVTFSQIVSGSFPSNSFLTYTGWYQLFVATFVGNQNLFQFNSLLLMSVDYFPQSLARQVQAGKFQALSYTTINCMYQLFITEMDSLPVININAYSPVYIQYQSDFPLIWLYNVTANGFGVCYKEQFAFSELKAIWISYLAVATPVRNISEAQTYIFDTNLNLAAGNEERFCEKINFTYRYSKIPMVFVTPEVLVPDLGVITNESMSIIGNLIAWVHSIDKNYVTVCTKNSWDNQTHRSFPVKVHYTVIGKIDACSSNPCAEELECQLDDNSKPYCGCKTSCPLTTDEVCGANFVTYSSECSMQMSLCKEFGNNTEIWPPLAYKGACKQYPYLTGSVKLDSVPDAPGAFCKYVTLNSNFFYEFYPLQVILTVSWDSNEKKMYDASAVWSENVTINGFNACVLVAGRHFFDSFSPPNVYWVAFQKGVFIPGLLDGGIIELPTWETGSQCALISLNDSRIPILLVSISLNSNKFNDALTVWHESYYSYTYFQNYIICARELQNFDGVHEGVKIHWLAIYEPIPVFISELGEVSLNITNDNGVTSTFCNVATYNEHSPILPDPVIFTSIGVKTGFSFSNINSMNDFSVWIESKNNTHMEVCMKSVNWAYNQYQTISVYYALYPRLCDEGYYYYENQCYQLLAKNYTFEQAQLQCSNFSASLPIITNPSDNVFLDLLAPSTVWLGLVNDEEESWEWTNNETLIFSNWGYGKPDGGMRENCAVSNGKQGWDDRLCSESYNVVCSEDAHFAERECSFLCQNGYCSSVGNGSIECICSPGFRGKWCDKQNPLECQNYVELNETWRRYIPGSLPQTPLNISCDNKLVKNVSMWVRFSPESGGKLWDQGCIESRNHCGVKYPGWLSIPHPSENDGIVTATLHFYSFYCASDAGLVNILNCGDYFVYNFLSIPYWSCDFGLCTI